MSALAGWMVEALIASALLMALVLLLRGPARRAFGPQVAYALWLLPLLRLVLPPLPEAWREAAATPISRAGETITVLVVSPAAPVAEVVTPSPGLLLSLGVALALAWAVGAAGFLVYHLVAHARFCRRIVAVADRVEERGGIRVVTSAAAPGPLAFGLWRRYIAFPLDFADRYDADERALALAHEIGHHQRGDLIANWIALTVLALHWFNPLAWRAFRAFRADQELANDAHVLAGRSVVERHIYACAIVKAAHGGAVSAACHLHTITDLKGRLKMLSLSPASRRRLSSGAAAVGALVVAGLGFTASGSSAAISAGVKAVTQAMPSTPLALPAPPAPVSVTTSADGDASTSVTSTVDKHKVKRVVVVKDGKSSTYEGAAADAYIADHALPIAPPVPGGSRMMVTANDAPDVRVEVQDIPAVSEEKCGIGTGKPMTMVIESGHGDKRKLVVCTDRIQAISTQAAESVDVIAIRRNAMSTARAGLETARSSIRSAPGMTQSQRQEALAGIDQAIAEMKSETKSAGKD